MQSCFLKNGNFIFFFQHYKKDADGLCVALGSAVHKLDRTQKYDRQTLVQNGFKIDGADLVFEEVLGHGEFGGMSIFYKNGLN